MRTAAAGLLTLIVLLPSPSLAVEPDIKIYGEGWQRLETGHFTLISNVKPRALADQALALARLERLLANEGEVRLAPTRPSFVYIFRDSKELEPFMAARSGKARKLAGIFIPKTDANYIVIDAGSRAWPMATIYHEYLHFVMHANFQEIPLWFDEGIAEFFSTFMSTQKGVEIGRPIADHMAVVKTAPLYEPAELFSVSTRSQDYNEDSRAGVFYAQSWGLVHYLLLGRPGHEVDWTRFLKILADGTPSGEALELAFGVDERGLNQELLQYAESEDWPSRHIPIEGALAVSLPEPTPLDAPDALYYLGDLMHHMDRDGNVAEATPWFEAALRLDPAHQKSANALLSMGEYRPPAGDDLPPIDPDRAIEAINGLIAAGNLDSALALARDLRNRTADPELREQLDENIGELEKTAGENRVIREYNRAVEMVNTGDYDAATRVLEAILPSARDPEIKAAIQKLLRDMESAGPR